MSVNGEEEELLELQNLILLNPDYEVDTFRSDHEELAQYCPAITVYADSRDVALKLAFRLNQKKSLGRNGACASTPVSVPLY
jgi:esterase/lipase superfamily enzyme